MLSSAPHMSGFLLRILFGTCLTLEVAVCAFLFGMTLGLMSAWLMRSTRWIKHIIKGILFIICGLPELLLLFFIYFGAAELFRIFFHFTINISAFAASVIALGLIFAAYATNIFQGAFLAIEPGQLEASVAIGFNRWQRFRYIELPQIWQHALPGLGNLWLVLLKDTALVSLVGLADLMNQTKMAASTTRQPFLFYLIAAGIYLIISTISTMMIHLSTQRIYRAYTTQDTL